VIIVDDPAYRAMAKDPTVTCSLGDLIRVRLAQGERQGVELIVRRFDVAPASEPEAVFDPFLAFLCFAVIAGSAALAWWETLSLKLRTWRETTRSERAARSSTTVRPRERPKEPKHRAIKRDAEAGERWLRWVAERNSRRAADARPVTPVSSRSRLAHSDS
jgi:hypothetical protein